MYQSLFQIAQDVAQNQVHSGAYVSPDDTVCVICSGNNRVYTGVNRIEMRDGRQVNIHAEITAMQNMQAAGESVITAMLLIKTYSRSPMLPCNGCIRYILSLSPENVNCKVALPDRMMPITEIGKPQQPAGNSGNFMGAAPYPQGMQMSGFHASSSVPYQGASPVSMMNGFSGSMPYQGAAPVSSNGTSSQSSGSVQGAGHYVGAAIGSKAKNANASYLKNRVGDLMSVADDDDNDDDEPETKTIFGRLFRK